MKTKTGAPKEDPETAAKRAVEEARAEADRTSATQKILDRRSRRVLRIFGGNPAAGGFSGAAGGGGGGGGGSGSSGVPAYTPGGFGPGADPFEGGKGWGGLGGFFY